MHPDIKEVFFDEPELKARIKELGKEISKDYAGKELILVCVLRGACMFAADLARCIDGDVELDFVALSSYGNSTKSSGTVKVLKDVASSVLDKHVLILDDILDTGLTLDFYTKHLYNTGAKSVEVGILLKKKGTQKCDLEPKYVGFECPREFIVGYGLDYQEKYRQLPYIGVLKDELISDAD